MADTMTSYWTDDMIARLERNNPWYRRAEAAGAPAARRGVNVCGYLRDESGWGSAVRGYVRALRTLDIPLAFQDLSPLSSNRSQDATLSVPEGQEFHDVNLVFVDPGQHYAFMSHVGPEFLEGRYNIGVWAWELPRFPQRWYDRFAFYDEIWVTTSFVAAALAPISPLPIVRVPPVLTSVGTGSREVGRRRVEACPDEFVFLFIFDVHSHIERKNPLAVVDAFKRAFAPSDPVRLVVKCVNGDDDPTGLAAVYRAAGGYPVSVYDGYWSAQEVRDLMAACDAYVSLHRSEGAGLTISDAMALGKPVIATGWSGNMDFMTVANSYPVRYELVAVEETVGPYHAGETWADPSVEHAAALMRHVVAHPTEAAGLGARARRDLAVGFSEAAVAGVIDQRLQVIAHRHGIAAFRREMKRFFAAYQQLGSRIAAVARAVIPAGATVLVVSKGDAELLNLEGRTAWHFPRSAGGAYAGYHPADSVAAIAHLEHLRAAGGAYLLFPGTAFWWLDHYAAFHNHLETHYRRVWSDDRCIIYHLSRSEELRSGADAAGPERT